MGVRRVKTRGYSVVGERQSYMTGDLAWYSSSHFPPLNVGIWQGSAYSPALAESASLVLHYSKHLVSTTWSKHNARYYCLWCTPAQHMHEDPRLRGRIRSFGGPGSGASSANCKYAMMSTSATEFVAIHSPADHLVSYFGQCHIRHPNSHM